MKVNDIITSCEQGVVNGNFLDIQYTTPEACREALSYNGACWDSSTVIGVVNYNNYRRRIDLDEKKVFFLLSHKSVNVL